MPEASSKDRGLPECRIPQKHASGFELGSSFDPGSLIPAGLLHSGSEAGSYTAYDGFSEIAHFSDDETEGLHHDTLGQQPGGKTLSQTPGGSGSSGSAQSIFGDFEEVGEEEWDVVSDEGSWEDEIFDESDICTISVHYGSKK